MIGLRDERREAGADTSMPTRRYPSTNDVTPQTAPCHASFVSPGASSARVIIPMPANDRMWRSMSGGGGTCDAAKRRVDHGRHAIGKRAIAK